MSSRSMLEQLGLTINRLFNLQQIHPEIKNEKAKNCIKLGHNARSDFPRDVKPATLPN